MYDMVSTVFLSIIAVVLIIVTIGGNLLVRDFYIYFRSAPRGALRVITCTCMLMFSKLQVPVLTNSHRRSPSLQYHVLFFIFSGDFDVQFWNGYKCNFEVFLHIFSSGWFDHWNVLSPFIFSILYTGILAIQQVVWKPQRLQTSLTLEMSSLFHFWLRQELKISLSPFVLV